MNQPKPPPPPSLSSAIAETSSNRPYKALTRHPHAVHGGAHSATECGQPAAARAQPDVHTGSDVVHVLDGLSHLGQRLFHLFIGSVEELFDGSQRSAQPDQDRRQGERHDEGGHPKRYPHEALAAQLVNTPAAPSANTPAILSARVLLAFRRFFGFAVRRRDEARQGLQEDG